MLLNTFSVLNSESVTNFTDESSQRSKPVELLNLDIVFIWKSGAARGAIRDALFSLRESSVAREQRITLSKIGKFVDARKMVHAWTYEYLVPTIVLYRNGFIQWITPNLCSWGLIGSEKYKRQSLLRCQACNKTNKFGVKLYSFATKKSYMEILDHSVSTNFSSEIVTSSQRDNESGSISWNLQSFSPDRGQSFLKIAKLESLSHKGEKRLIK